MGMAKARTGQRPSVQRNSEITQIKSEILAKSQNEHKPKKGLALIPHEANNNFAHTIITKISGILDKP